MFDTKETSVKSNIVIYDKNFDFRTKWTYSDGAIKTSDSEELLYVNKRALAENSPFFDRLFFGHFAEAKQDVVNVDIEFWSMQTILELIHIGKQKGIMISVDFISILYRYADKYVIPSVKDYCKKSLVHWTTDESFKVAFDLELSEEKIAILNEMDYSQIEILLAMENNNLQFSPKEVAIIVKKAQEIAILNNMTYSEIQNLLAMKNNDLHFMPKEVAVIVKQAKEKEVALVEKAEEKEVALVEKAEENEVALVEKAEEKEVALVEKAEENEVALIEKLARGRRVLNYPAVPLS